MKERKKSHVKVGDKVKILAGDQKGIIGNIQAVFRETSLVFVEGIAPRIKYVKNKQGGESKKTELSIPIHISNVMLWDSTANLSSRIGYKLLNSEKKRYFKKSGNFI